MLSRENILNNLRRLGDLLKEQGLAGEILLTGGHEASNAIADNVLSCGTHYAQNTLCL
jgi:hypothetical protein